MAHAAALAALWRLAPAPPPPPPPTVVRLVDTAHVHIGLRLAAANEGAALTLQISIRTPW